MDEFDTLMNLVVGDVATEARRSYSLTVGDEVDGFKITGHIGLGATSEVYSAVNPDFGTDCALKILREGDSSGVERFTHEAQLLVGIRHNNIVRVFRAGQWKGRAWIAMERLRALPENPTPDLVREWLLKICSAVTALSNAGIVHRDIKTGNILWDPVRGEPVLADFGIAANPPADAGPGALSAAPQRGAACGTGQPRVSGCAGDGWKEVACCRFRCGACGSVGCWPSVCWCLRSPRWEDRKNGGCRNRTFAAGIRIAQSISGAEQSPRPTSWQYIGESVKTLSLYVSKDEDAEATVEIPKGHKLVVSEAIEFVVYDDAIVNAAMNQDWAKVRALQKSFKLKKITLKVVGGGELDVPKLKFSLAGVEDGQVIIRPEMKIDKLPNGIAPNYRIESRQTTE